MAGPAAVFRYPFRASLVTALALAQVGEFSFVLAQTGQAAGLLTDGQYQTFLAAAVVTMALTPVLIAAGPRLAASPRWARVLRIDWDVGEPAPVGTGGHVVIAGYGFNGRNLATALRDLGVSYVVLEMNPETVRARRAEGESIHYGDCTRPAVLECAGIARARVFVVAISDPASTRRAIQVARSLNPGLRVVVRTRYQSEIADLKKLGAAQVVPEEFETSVEMLARVLGELDVPAAVIRRLEEGIRADHYGAFAGAGFGRVPLRLPDDVRGAVETDVVELPPTAAGVGWTIGELRLRTRTGATVVAVRRGDRLLPNPGPELRLEAGDGVILIGNLPQLAAGREAVTERPS